MSGQPTPLTPLAVVKQLSQLARELDQTTDMLYAADLDAADKRQQADITESKAFLATDGPMDIRRHTARVLADKVEQEALVAEALVRFLKNKLKSLDLRIEVGRSMGTSLRAEMKLMPYSEQP